MIGNSDVTIDFFMSMVTL